MKHSLIALFLLSLTSFAYADLGQVLDEKCSHKEIKDLIGSTGSCRVVVAPKPLIKKGACAGTLYGTLKCVVSYFSTRDQGAMNITCMSGSSKTIDETMEAEGIAYSSVMILKTASGHDLVGNNPEDIHVISNGAITMLLAETNINGEKEIFGEVTLKLESRNYTLTDLVCQ